MRRLNWFLDCIKLSLSSDLGVKVMARYISVPGNRQRVLDNRNWNRTVYKTSCIRLYMLSLCCCPISKRLEDLKLLSNTHNRDQPGSSSG